MPFLIYRTGFVQIELPNVTRTGPATCPGRVASVTLEEATLWRFAMHTYAWVVAAMSFFAAPVAQPPVLASLIAVLRDPDVETRAYASIALAAVGGQSVDPLIEGLQDKDRLVRAGAAYALSQLGA